MRGLLQPATAGVVGSATGFFGSVVVLLAGIQASGASRAQATSGLLVLCLVIGVLSISLSLRHRIPICIAWSTPGAALLISARVPSFPDAVGAFLLAGLLVVVTGAVPALAALLRRIPTALSGALLAGVLWPFCISTATAAVRAPAIVLPLALVWLVLQRVRPRAAGPVVIVVALAVTLAGGAAAAPAPPVLLPVLPALDPAVLIGVGVPLFLVTMAGQQLPGLALLAANGHRPPARELLVATGAATGLAAVFGGSGVNLAAITGAIMVGPDAGADPRRRWPAGVASGASYLVLAPFAALVAAVAGHTSTDLLQAAVGLALLPPLLGALTTALQDADRRIPAAATFLVVASGIAVAGIGSAFWGLCVGAVAHLVLVRRRREEAVAP